MRNLSKKAKTIIAGAAIAGLASTGVAYAYWTTTGHGDGSATTGTSSEFVVTTAAADGELLTPGGPTQTVAFHVQNTNSGIQHLSAVAVTVANDDGSDWTLVEGCSADDYAVGTPVFIPGDIAFGEYIHGTVTIQMINNTEASQDGCKEATVPLYVDAS